jgi:hypothetical protein
MSAVFPYVFGAPWARRALRPSYTPSCALLRRRRAGSSCSRVLGWRPCSSKILALTYWCGSASTIVAPSSGRTYDLLILCLAPSCGSRGRRRNGERVTAQNYERWKANPRRGASPMSFRGRAFRTLTDLVRSTALCTPTHLACASAWSIDHVHARLIVSSCVLLERSVRPHQSALRTNRRLHRGGA